MTGGSVARRYAKALIELAAKGDRVDAVGEEIGQTAGLFESSADLRNLMFSPGIVKDVKRGILRELLARASASDLSGRFLQLLLEKDRLRYIAPISAMYRELADALNNRIRAQVRSAFALSDEEETALRNQLSAATGKEVVLEVETDSTLLGGLKARVGSATWDGSVRNHLESLRERLAGRS
ncbi:MAG: ATP synthase F1 subunit delta [Nitrospinota bacterium]|nr:ATP synthase F1 subunit delta [Nitrospinota bacterium]